MSIVRWEKLLTRTFNAIRIPNGKNTCHNVVTYTVLRHIAFFFFFSTIGWCLIYRNKVCHTMHTIVYVCRVQVPVHRLDKIKDKRETYTKNVDAMEFHVVVNDA